jgi:hypothetical protein
MRAGAAFFTDRSSALRWAAAFTLLDLILVMPRWPEDLIFQSFLRLPLELPLILLLLLLLPGFLKTAARWLLTAAILLLAVLKIADLTTFMIFGREFNAFVHLPPVLAGLNVVERGFGALAAAAIVAVVIAAVITLALVIHWSLKTLGTAPVSSSRPRPILASLMMLAAFFVFDRADIQNDGTPLAAVEGIDPLRDHAIAHWDSHGDRDRFRQHMAKEEFRDVPSGQLLNALGRTDVLFVLIESYGRGTVENPLFASKIGESLSDFEKEIGAAGFSARSAWLESSTAGGQSWLAQSTLMSGLRIDRAGRYDALLMSGHPTLVSDFARAGWRTVAVMPALVNEWEAADFFGFDGVYTAGNLGYRGKPFNWITMPDQYTLSAFHARELAGKDRKPVMAEIALVSSHMPWTPIPNLMPWDAIGDGAVFDEANRHGEAPKTLWQNKDKVRDYYRQSITYVLDTVKSYVATHGSDDLMLVLLGDHQPVPFVIDNDPSRQVPVHVIAKRPDLVKALGAWGWSDGMTPAATAPVMPMEDMRKRVLTTFTPKMARGS